MSVEDTPKPTSEPPQLQNVRRALSDPIRLRILEALWEAPKTAKAVAARLRVPPNRLYYHLRTLEAAGVIAVVGHEVVGRFAERVYGARQFHYGRDLPGLDPEDRAALFAAMLQASAEELSAAARAATPIHRVFRGTLFVDPNRLNELLAQLDHLLDASGPTKSGPGARALHLTLAAYELPTP